MEEEAEGADVAAYDVGCAEAGDVRFGAIDGMRGNGGGEGEDGAGDIGVVLAQAVETAAAVDTEGGDRLRGEEEDQEA